MLKYFCPRGGVAFFGIDRERAVGASPCDRVCEGSRVVTAKNGHCLIRPRRHLALRGYEETSFDVLKLGGTAIYSPQDALYRILGLFCFSGYGKSD